MTLGLTALLLGSGCVSHMLANRIVTAPNHHGVRAPYNDPRMLKEFDAMCRATWRHPVGPPAAEIAVAVVDPGDFKLKFDIKVTQNPTGQSQGHFTTQWTYPKADDATARSMAPPKGTLVFLHGIMMTKESVLPWALYFAQQQYRVVLVDLRGHGRSTGAKIGYGTWEVDDLMKVTDELHARDLLVGRLGVIGISYGAAVGLQWASRDPRVATVVALAPFSDPVIAIPEFARGLDPRTAGKVSNATFAAAETKAAALGGFTWDEVNVERAVRRLTVPVLFFHGQQDTWVPPTHSEILYRAAPSGSRRVLLANDNHISIAVRLDLIGPDALSWFNEQLLPSPVALTQP